MKISKILSCLVLTLILTTACTQEEISNMIDTVVAHQLNSDGVEAKKVQKIYFSDEEILQKLLDIGEEGTLNDFTFKYDAVNIGISLVKYKGQEAILTLPESVKELYITEIAKDCFKDSSFLTNIELPGQLAVIGEEAFAQCTSLKEVVMPDSVSTMGGYAFRDCSSLLSVTVSGRLRTVGWGAFKGCTSLEKVTIRDGVQLIAGDAFAGCTALEEVDFTETLIAIATASFEGCVAIDRESKAKILRLNDKAFG